MTLQEEGGLSVIGPTRPLKNLLHTGHKPNKPKPTHRSRESKAHLLKLQR